jgi:hypothetical protein
VDDPWCGHTGSARAASRWVEHIDYRAARGLDRGVDRRPPDRPGENLIIEGPQLAKAGLCARTQGVPRQSLGAVPAVPRMFGDAALARGDGRYPLDAAQERQYGDLPVNPVERDVQAVVHTSSLSSVLLGCSFARPHLADSGHLLHGYASRNARYIVTIPSMSL